MLLYPEKCWKVSVHSHDPLKYTPCSEANIGPKTIVYQTFRMPYFQVVRTYKERRYILDSGGHHKGTRGVSAYIQNNNLYFNLAMSTAEDTLTWTVRTSIFTVRYDKKKFCRRLKVVCLFPLKALAKRTRKSTQVLDLRSTFVSFGHPLACDDLRGLALTLVELKFGCK